MVAYRCLRVLSFSFFAVVSSVAQCTRDLTQIVSTLRLNGIALNQAAFLFTALFSWPS
jgi:hypothetical protein